jgi:hypothetical protein
MWFLKALEIFFKIAVMQGKISTMLSEKAENALEL